MSIMFKRIIFYKKLVRQVHSTRAITGDRIRELNEETLTGRLLHFLIGSKNQLNPINSVESPSISRINNFNDLKQYKIEQILSALNLLSKREHCKSRKQFLSLLNLFDTELCMRFDLLETVDALNILHTYMNVIPHRIIEYKFYGRTMEKLSNDARNLSKTDLIQFIFYLGLQKKTTKCHNMLNTCINLFNEDMLNNLSAEELCIICNSTFKTSTKIHSKLFLDKVNHYLTNNLNVLKDPAFFITLIKTIRHNRHQNEELLATISYTMFFNKTIHCYSFAALCHILALYSDYLYYDDTLMQVFTEKGLQILKSSDVSSRHLYLTEQPRTKDLKRFLWSLSNLNFKYLGQQDFRNIVSSNIIKRIENGELKSDVESCIEMCLYLWILNYRESDLILSALTKENIEHIRAITSPTKLRLNTLLTCIYFEDRALYKKINIHPQGSPNYNMQPQLEKRALLQKIFEMLKLIPAKFEIDKYVLDCQVPYLNIIGITGYRKKIYKAVHIEVLDEYTCMKNTEGTPSGLMQLKLRLLECLDEGIIVIRANEVESMNSEDFANFLEDELDLVC